MWCVKFGKAKENRQYPQEGCTLRISKPIKTRKNGKRDTNPITKLNCGSKVTQKKGCSRICRQFGSSEAKKGLENTQLPLWKPDNTWSVKAYFETVTLPKAQGGEIFHTQWEEATGNSIKEELITQKLAYKTFPNSGSEKPHSSNLERRGFYQLLG